MLLTFSVVREIKKPSSGISGTRGSSVHPQHQEPVPARLHRHQGLQSLLRGHSVQRRRQPVSGGKTQNGERKS